MAVKEIINEQGYEVDSLPLLLKRLDIGLSKMLEIKKDGENDE